MNEQDKLDLELAINQIESTAQEFIKRLYEPLVSPGFDKKLNRLQDKLFFNIREAKLVIDEIDTNEAQLAKCALAYLQRNYPNWEELIKGK